MECFLTRKWSFTRKQTNDLYENHRRVRLESPGYTRWKLWWCVWELNQGWAKNLFALILYLPREPRAQKHTYSAADTNLSRCPSFSSRTSLVRASPVDCRPITMHWEGEKQDTWAECHTKTYQPAKNIKTWLYFLCPIKCLDNCDNASWPEIPI